MRWMALIFWAAVLSGCTPARSPTSQPALSIDAKAPEAFFLPTGPGSTELSKVPGGYQLLNRLYRVVISEQTGDVIFWSTATAPRNIVFHRGIYTVLTHMTDAPPHGYVEKRDDETWQFHGEDDNHINWQKIYCLHNNSLLVSIVITNHQPQPVTTCIQINGDLPDLRIQYHQPEHFVAAGGYGTISLHGYNEAHNPSMQPTLPTLIQSDLFQLNPAQQQSYTSQWMLSQ